MASKLSKGLSEQVTCAICLGHYSDPRLLPCLHTYCRHCLQDLLARGKTTGSVSCPECREVVQISGDAAKLKVNFWINNILSLLALHSNEETEDGVKIRLSCENCDINEKATDRCMDCRVFLCDFCSTAHQRFVATKGHQLVTLDELKNTDIPVFEKQLFCKRHKGEIMKLFCNTCQELICRDCTIIDHRGHKFNFIDDVADQQKSIFGKEIQRASKVKNNVEKALKSVQEMKRSVKKTSKATEKDVDDFINKEIRVLEEKRVSLKQKIRTITAKKTKELATQEDGLVMHMTGLKSAIQFTENLLKNGGNNDILSISKEITSRFLQICEKQFTNEPCQQDGLTLKFLGRHSVDLTEHHDVTVVDTSVIPDPKQCSATQSTDDGIVPIQSPINAKQGQSLNFIVYVNNVFGKELPILKDRIAVKVKLKKQNVFLGFDTYGFHDPGMIAQAETTSASQKIDIYPKEDNTYSFSFHLEHDILQAEIDVTIDGVRVQGCPFLITNGLFDNYVNQLCDNYGNELCQFSTGLDMRQEQKYIW